MSNTQDLHHKPFFDSIKRIGEQARNWENIADYGTNLDILKPSTRRGRMLNSSYVVGGLLGLVLAALVAQTVILRKELRTQRETIEQLSTLVKEMKTKKR